MILFFEQNLLQNLVLLLHAYKSHQRQGRERKSAWIIENLLFENTKKNKNKFSTDLSSLAHTHFCLMIYESNGHICMI